MGEQFVAAYERIARRSLGQGRLDFWVGVALLELAYKELRRLKPDWHDRASAILVHCLDELNRSAP